MLDRSGLANLRAQILLDRSRGCFASTGGPSFMFLSQGGKSRGLLALGNDHHREELSFVSIHMLSEYIGEGSWCIAYLDEGRRDVSRLDRSL